MTESRKIYWKTFLKSLGPSLLSILAIILMTILLSFNVQLFVIAIAAFVIIMFVVIFIAWGLSNVKEAHRKAKLAQNNSSE